MTSKEIYKRTRSVPAVLSPDNDGSAQQALWEVALQLALLNERLQRFDVFITATNERYRMVVERYLELTAKAVKKPEVRSHKAGRVVRKPTTVKFKTKEGRPVRMKAVKTEIQHS